MSKKLIIIIAIIIASVLAISIALSCVARFVFLSPSCYSDNNELTEQENYLIKKTVLESVEERLSVFASNTNNIYDPSATEIEIIQLDETQNNRKHIFIWINTDFMESVTKENDEYVIRVFNTGENILANDLSHIWQSFYRADKSHSRAEGRFGLGLSIVASIQELHHRKYSVENKENGVEFSFTVKKTERSQNL